MQITFAEYRFLTDKQVLYKHDELIPLKRNQAALLQFFLTDPESIHSKDDILNSVWQDKVVSEQVVFQTISQLRTIFGDKAIQTFSKKGYKWQLIPKTTEQIDNAIEQTEQACESLQEHELEKRPEKEPTNTQAKSNNKTFLALASALVLSVSFIYQLLNNQQPTIPLHLLVNDALTENNTIIEQAIESSDAFTMQSFTTELSPRQAFTTPKLAWQKANLSPKNWLIWSESFTSEKGIFLHYGLSLDKFNWQGYVFAESQEKLPALLGQRLQELHALGLFSAKPNKIDAEKLKNMLRKAPDDVDLLLQLAKYYDNIEHYDVALGYLDKLLNRPPLYSDAAYKAQAHWHIGKIYKHRNQHVQAHNSLDEMSKVLADVPVWPLFFNYVKAKSWLAYDKRDYPTMFQTLEQGLRFFNQLSEQSGQKGGEQQTDPLPLFKLHILYSILAKKAGDDAKKYHHLNQAQALLLKHKLDESNLAVVYYHYALFAQQEAQKNVDSTSEENNLSYTVYLHQILELPRTSDNFWIQDAAFEMLVKDYIQQQDYHAAHVLFGDEKLRPKKQLLKAEVYIAQKNISQAQELLQTAFAQARIEYDTRVGIDAALTLYRLSADNPKAKAEYWAYLENNAKPQWLQENVVAAD